MNFELSDEQDLFVMSVRKLAEERLALRALERAHTPGYPWDAARILADQGLLGLTIRESDGGQGALLLDAVLALQEVAAFCPKSVDVIQAGNFGAIRTFAEYASDDLKERFLPNLLAGESVIALGMSEPDAGSAVTSLQTTAARDGSNYVINGSKMFSTHSADAAVFLVYVRYGPGTDGIGSMIVERDTDGFEVGPPTQFMSGEQWCPLYFSNCSVSADNVVLGPGGFKRQMSGFNVERIGNATRSIALGRLAFNLAKQHAMEREQFGRKLCEFQGIQWKFAEMAMKLDSAQLLLYRAVANADRGLPSAYDTSVAKLAANLAGFEVSNEAMQVMGALGYGTDTLVEYCMLRTRGWMIAGGSLEMLKNRIAETVFDRRFSQRG